MWMMQRVLFGPKRAVPEEVHDLPWFEAAAMGILVALIVVYGILPGFLVHVIVNSPVYGFPGFP
jgi:NADH:ubiquinone oxidoreductase subunit 4 (subunit M)